MALTVRNEDTLKQFLAQLQGMYHLICLNSRPEELNFGTESSLHVEELDTGSKHACFSDTIEAYSYVQHVKIIRVTYV